MAKCRMLLMGVWVALCSCSNAAQDQKTVQSWIASVQFAGDSWAQGIVPTAYTRDLLRNARRELQATGARISPESAAGLRLHRALQALDELAGAVAKGDRARAAQLAHSLGATNAQSRQSQAHGAFAGPIAPRTGRDSSAARS